MTSLLVTGGTIIDAVSDRPLEGSAVWVESGRVKAIAPVAELAVPAGTPRVDAKGMYVIPGLMNANVHLLGDFRPENLLKHEGRFEELIVEAAQIALRSGLTTVFDTWGPRRPLMDVRDRIARGELVGSRFFCAGNILGIEGPFSRDFIARAPDVLSPALTTRLNALWVENVGHDLLWLAAEDALEEVRRYIATGIDFVKFLSDQHPSAGGAFLALSPRLQARIVELAHSAGTTAQAHTHTVEGLRNAIEAGCDLIQHANMSGPVPIPENTLARISERITSVVVFPFSDAAMRWLGANASAVMNRNFHSPAADANARAFIRFGARILLGNDGMVLGPDALSDVAWSRTWVGLPEEHSIVRLATGHFVWLEAMEEKGMSPLELLRAATTNIAKAYRKDAELGTLEPGKCADMVILERDPLADARNYRSIRHVIKDGVVIDPSSLPAAPVLTSA